jgi:putative transposase
MDKRPGRRHPAEGVLIFRDQPTIVFVTICSRKRRSHLANDSVHNALVESGRTAKAWLVGFYLIMPDHVHLFCAPNNEDHKIRRMGLLLETPITPQAENIRSTFSSTRLSHRLQRDESYSEKWDYVRMNPIRAGWTADRDGWPYQGVLNELPWWN